MELTENQQAKRELFRAISFKGEFRRIADKMLRETPEYRQAREEGRARDWLEQEGDSAAQMLYDSMVARITDLDP